MDELNEVLPDIVIDGSEMVEQEYQGDNSESQRDPSNDGKVDKSRAGEGSNWSGVPDGANGVDSATPDSRRWCRFTLHLPARYRVERDMSMIDADFTLNWLAHLRHQSGRLRT